MQFESLISFATVMQRFLKIDFNAILCLIQCKYGSIFIHMSEMSNFNQFQSHLNKQNGAILKWACLKNRFRLGIAKICLENLT